jgi:hypothetical protein
MCVCMECGSYKLKLKYEEHKVILIDQDSDGTKTVDKTFYACCMTAVFI